jgi:hypothetical protein
MSGAATRKGIHKLTLLPGIMFGFCESQQYGAV